MNELSCRPLSVDDISAAVALSSEPGWNQVAQDWRLMIDVGQSFGYFTESGKLVASGLTVPYMDLFGWISMILVTESHRRRGLATALMRQCMDALLARDRIPALDATPEGRKVYLPLGFEGVYRLTRFFANDPRRMQAAPQTGVALRPLELSDLEAVIAYDTMHCGAGRDHLLRHLQARLRACAWLAETHGRIVGYVLARDGRTCSQIGPLVADAEATAAALFSTALSALPGPVCIDLGQTHEALAELLLAAGFAPQFPFIRMIHERSQPFDDPSRIFAIAGPELG